MTAFPPRERLARLADALAHHLPQQYASLLADERFADARAALDRLARPGGPAAAAAALPPDEAARLADLLRERWATLGEPALDPAAALVGPDTVPVGGRAVYEVVTDGVDNGWTAAWLGPATADPDDPAPGRTAVWAPTAPGPARLAVRVFARTGDRRHVLVAARTVTAVTEPGPAGGPTP